VARIKGIPFQDAWIAFICIRCTRFNTFRVGSTLLDPKEAFETAVWKCEHCGFVHSRESPLPFRNWPPRHRRQETLPAERFWIGFFRIATEHRESYWKQCPTCGRVLPFHAFSRHVGWGILERQMECRACKGGINAILNPLRTPQQHHESSARRRVADLLLEGENRPVDFVRLFQLFGSRCFKCKKSLSRARRSAWEVDHILPSKYLYPLTPDNAELLCTGCNNTKHGRWPREYFTNGELIKLAELTGANLEILSRREPVVNPNVDVNACVARYLAVREHSNLAKRIAELKGLLAEYNLAAKLSRENRRRLGID
jgi:5-methylcytosine-specific restriction endonuclease McrA